MDYRRQQHPPGANSVSGPFPPKGIKGRVIVVPFGKGDTALSSGLASVCPVIIGHSFVRRLNVQQWENSIGRIPRPDTSPMHNLQQSPGGEFANYPSNGSSRNASPAGDVGLPRRGNPLPCVSKQNQPDGNFVAVQFPKSKVGEAVERWETVPLRFALPLRSWSPGCLRRRFCYRLGGLHCGQHRTAPQNVVRSVNHRCPPSSSRSSGRIPPPHA